MAMCSKCGKKPSFGSNVSFSKRHTKRMWRPNVQTTTVIGADGKPEQIKVCTQCLRTMMKVR